MSDDPSAVHYTNKGCQFDHEGLKHTVFGEGEYCGFWDAARKVPANNLVRKLKGGHLK